MPIHIVEEEKRLYDKIGVYENCIFCDKETHRHKIQLRKRNITNQIQSQSFDISDFVDYKKLFDFLIDEGVKPTDETKREFELFSKEMSEFELVSDECSIDGADAIFVFGITYQTANESDPSNEWLSIVITINLNSLTVTKLVTEAG